MEKIHFDDYPCWCREGEEQGLCFCLQDERALNRYAYRTEPMPAMTAEQREWCIREAVDAGEGAIEEQTIRTYTDSDLAKEVIRAWVTYVNSQFGL